MENSVIILRISLAILIGTIIGIEREIKNRPAGMRTHILVCLGAVSYTHLDVYKRQPMRRNIGTTPCGAMRSTST